MRFSLDQAYQDDSNQLVDDRNIAYKTEDKIQVADAMQVDDGTNGNVESVGELSALCDDNVNRDININDIVCKTSNSLEL